MFDRLKRHPFSVEAFFEQVLVLTYALPRRVLEPLLPPGLSLDCHGPHGFLAIALVQTQALRPQNWPRSMGRDFFLAGYRVFARYRRSDGRAVRGLRILRSYTDRNSMVTFGNLLTHYDYRRADVDVENAAGQLHVRLHTRNEDADLDVVARIDSAPAALPEGSPFTSVRQARRFAGPLPYTFDYERSTHSIVVIEGVRHNWRPQPVRVQVLRNTFVDHERFGDHPAVLASAFHLSNVPYRWKRGVLEPLEGRA